MPVRETGPTDDEFTKLMDERAPNRLREPDVLPEYAPSPTLDVAPDPVPVLPEDGLVPEPELVAPVDPKYAGKTTDELIEMHRNAEQLIGTQGQRLGEVNDLRNELAELRGALSAREPQQAPLTQETVDWVEESVLGNPIGTMDWVEKNQPALKERALATWAAIDPYAAAAYNTQQLLAEQDKKWQARLESVEAPFRVSQADANLKTAYQNVVTTLPGFTDVVGDLPGIIERNPEYKAALVNGNIEQQQRALENLGKIALFERAVAQPVDAPVAPVVPVVDPRITASVASGSSTGEHGGETATPTDKLKASMLATESTNLHAELTRNRAATAR